MCIDDYEFRHYSAIKKKQCRRFVITNQDQIERTYLVNISQFQQNGEIALCKILLYLSNKGLPIAERLFYLSKYDVFLHPHSQCKVPFAALIDKDINLRSVLKEKMPFMKDQHKNILTNQSQLIYNVEHNQPHGFQIEDNCCFSCIGKKQKQKQKEKEKLKEKQKEKQKQDFDIRNLLTQAIDQPQYQEEIEQLEYIPPLSPTKEKRAKQPQRKIGQVLYAVKKWRKLYQAKKMKLVQSAKFIGISKKSLDDYFLVLRVGEILGFNFEQNLQNKMGDLRTFIRGKDEKVTGKLPKQLKCFDLLPQIDLDQFMDIEQGQQNTQNDENNNSNEMKDEGQYLVK